VSRKQARAQQQSAKSGRAPETDAPANATGRATALWFGALAGLVLLALIAWYAYSTRPQDESASTPGAPTAAAEPT
jgi:hypothetical protein